MNKIFFDGVQIASNTTTVASTTRNSEITVFATNRTSASTSVVNNAIDENGYYYSIDDGSMTNAEAALYASDVKILQESLGRLPKKAHPMKYSIIVGQSLAAGSMGSPALSTSTQQYSNKTFAGGMLSPSTVLQAGLGPLVEGTVETIASSFTNFISSTARAQVPGDETQDLTISNW